MESRRSDNYGIWIVITAIVVLLLMLYLVGRAQSPTVRQLPVMSSAPLPTTASQSAMPSSPAGKSASPSGAVLPY